MTALTQLLNQYRSNNQLSYRLLIYIVTCSSLLAILSTGAQLLWDYRADIKTIEKGIKSIEVSYLDSLASSLWKLDKDQISIQLDGIMKLPDIGYASITEIVAGKEDAVFFRGDRSLELPISRVFDLHYKETLVGRLEVGATLDLVYERLLHKFLVILGSQAIKTFLVSICILIIVHYLVVRHLNTLSRQTHRLNLNNLDINLELNDKIRHPSRPDAIDQLADTLERMKKNIQEQVKQKRKAKDDLLHLNEELEQRVKYRTATLNHTNERLRDALEELTETKDKLVESEKMASLGQLVAGVAHEINTPVGNAITAATYLQDTSRELAASVADNNLSKQALAQHCDDLQSAAEQVFRNLDQAAKLITSFKQIAVDQSVEVAHAFNMRQNLQQVLDTLDHQLRKAGVHVDIHCDETLQFFSYPGSLVQIYTNLIMNSLLHGFSTHGGGTIDIRIDATPSEITIQYRDDGRGIPEPIKHKVFDPFVTSNRSGGGSGLGTHIIYNQVTQRLSGSIRCESEREQGVLFEIRLPRASTETRDDDDLW